MEVIESLHSSTSDLTEHASSTSTLSTAKSKIPRFKRSQSMRLKGEKYRPHLQTSNFLPPPPPPQKSALTLCNLRVVEDDDDYHDVVSDPLAPQPRQRSFSLKSGDGDHHHRCRHKSAQKASTPSEYGSLPPTPLPSPDVEDSQSMKSFRSFGSAMSLDAFTTSSLSASIGVNRRKKFVVHCQSHNHDDEEYLTPTQRKDRLIRQLKAMLLRSRRELDEKEAEISRLTTEAMELKMFKSDVLSKIELNSSPLAADSSNSNTKSYDDLNSVFTSTRDSGHFEESGDPDDDDDAVVAVIYENGSLVSASCKDEATNTSIHCDDNTSKLINVVTPRQIEVQAACLQADLEDMYRREIEDLKRQHCNEYQEMKEKYNDRIENLLQKLSEANTRYFDLRPKYDRSQERIRQLESQVQMLEADTKDDDKRHHQMYLKMYKKGQEAARFEHADEVLEFAMKAPKRVSVPEILKQLQLTERELDRVKALYRRELHKQSDGVARDSEMTLKFLKDAIYYFLTNKDGRDHLKAIESIMGYSDSERHNIERSVSSRSKLI